MKVFPFTNPALLKPVVVQACQSDQFIMDYPCVIGFVIIFPEKEIKSRRRNTWYVYEDGQIHHTTWQRKSATVFHNREQLDHALAIIGMLKGIKTVFVEPLKNGNK